MFKTVGVWSGHSSVADAAGDLWANVARDAPLTNYTKRVSPRCFTTWISMDTWTQVSALSSANTTADGNLRTLISGMSGGGKLTHVTAFTPEGDFLYDCVRRSKLHQAVSRHLYVPPRTGPTDLVYVLGLSDSSTLGSNPAPQTASTPTGVLTSIGTEEITTYMDWAELQSVVLSSNGADRYVAIGYDEDGDWFLSSTQAIGNTFQYYSRNTKATKLFPGDSTGVYSLGMVSSDIAQAPVGITNFEPMTSPWPHQSGEWQAIPFCATSGVHSMTGNLKLKDNTWSSHHIDGHQNSVFIQAWPAHTSDNPGSLHVLADEYSLLGFNIGPLPYLEGATLNLSPSIHSLFSFDLAPAGTNRSQDPVIMLQPNTSSHGNGSLRITNSGSSTAVRIQVGNDTDVGSEALANALIGNLVAGCVVQHDIVNSFGDSYWS